MDLDSFLIFDAFEIPHQSFTTQVFIDDIRVTKLSMIVVMTHNRKHTSREIEADFLLQIKQLSEQELAKFWSMYVKELAVLLVSVEGDEDPGSQVMGRIKALVQTELLSLYIRYSSAMANIISTRKRSNACKKRG